MGKRILIIEDEADTREALRDALEAEGYVIDAAVHGRDALEKLAAGQELPGLILLDQMMPVMSGAEFLKAVKADARLAAIPVMVVSAQAAAADALGGAACFVRKPVDLTELLDKIQVYLA